MALYHTVAHYQHHHTLSQGFSFFIFDLSFPLRVADYATKLWLFRFLCSFSCDLIDYWTTMLMPKCNWIYARCWWSHYLVTHLIIADNMCKNENFVAWSAKSAVQYKKDHHICLFTHFIFDVRDVCLYWRKFLTTFVGSNQVYALRRSFPESFEKFSFLFITLVIALTRPDSLFFMYFSNFSMFAVCVCVEQKTSDDVCGV